MGEENLPFNSEKMKEQVLSFLKENSIEFTLHNHKVVFTANEAKEYCHMVK